MQRCRAQSLATRPQPCTWADLHLPRSLARASAVCSWVLYCTMGTVVRCLACVCVCVFDGSGHKPLKLAPVVRQRVASTKTVQRPGKLGTPEAGVPITHRVVQFECSLSVPFLFPHALCDVRAQSRWFTRRGLSLIRLARCCLRRLCRCTSHVDPPATPLGWR